MQFVHIFKPYIRPIENHSKLHVIIDIRPGSIFQMLASLKLNKVRKRYFVDNKAKVQISRWRQQENKARQIFRKTNISYPLMRTRTCVYQGIRNLRFSENLASFIFLLPPSYMG